MDRVPGVKLTSKLDDFSQYGGVSFRLLFCIGCCNIRAYSIIMITNVTSNVTLGRKLTGAELSPWSADRQGLAI